MKISLKSDYRQSKRGNIYVCCPFCFDRVGSPDEGYHMGIDTVRGLYHCYKCNASPKETGQGFLREMNLYVEPPSPELSELKDRVKGLFKKVDSLSINLDAFTCKISSEETPYSYKYVMSRGITPEDIERYQIRAGMTCDDSKRWSGRVVFPCMSDNQCRYAVGRSYNGASQKYLNTAGSRSQIIYWKHLVGKTVIINEGIITAIAATKHTGIQAIPILGKVVTNHQANILRSMCDHAILSLDGDVVDLEIASALKTLFKAGFHEVEVVTLPPPVGGKTPGYKSDASDYSKSEYLSFFENRKSHTIFSKLNCYLK